MPGIDSAVADGVVGVLEGSDLALYMLDYDPCGGGCPERGHTRVQRCDRLTFAGSGCMMLEECFQCAGHGTPATRSAASADEEPGSRRGVTPTCAAASPGSRA